MKINLYRFMAMGMCVSWSLLAMDEKEDIVIEEKKESIFKNMKIFLQELISQNDDQSSMDYSGYAEYVESINAMFDDVYFGQKGGLILRKKSEGLYLKYNNKKSAKNLRLTFLLHPMVNDPETSKYFKFQNLLVSSNGYMDDVLANQDLTQEGKKSLYRKLIGFKARVANTLKETLRKDLRNKLFAERFNAIKTLEEKRTSWIPWLYYRYIYNPVSSVPATLSDDDMKKCCTTLKGKLEDSKLQQDLFTEEQYCYVCLYILVLRQLRYFVNKHVPFSEVLSATVTIGSIGFLGLMGLGIASRFLSSSKTVPQGHRPVDKSSIGSYSPSTGPTDKYLMFREKKQS